MSCSHHILKYLTKTLDRACVTMVGSLLAGVYCVMMAVQPGFDAKAGLPVSILLTSLNMLLVSRASDNGQNAETVPFILPHCRNGYRTDCPGVFLDTWRLFGLCCGGRMIKRFLENG